MFMYGDHVFRHKAVHAVKEIQTGRYLHNNEIKYKTCQKN